MCDSVVHGGVVLTSAISGIFRLRHLANLSSKKVNGGIVSTLRNLCCVGDDLISASENFRPVSVGLVDLLLTGLV